MQPRGVLRHHDCVTDVYVSSNHEYKASRLLNNNKEDNRTTEVVWWPLDNTDFDVHEAEHEDVDDPFHQWWHASDESVTEFMGDYRVRMDWPEC